MKRDKNSPVDFRIPSLVEGLTSKYHEFVKLFFSSHFFILWVKEFSIVNYVYLLW